MSTAELPDDVELVRVTADFDECSVPRGLLAAHRVADGVWGRLIVRSGRLDLVFEDRPGDRQRLAAGDSAVLPPGARHHVEVVGPVVFAVEFHRRPDAAGDTVGG